MRTRYWTALSLFQVTEPRNMDASSSSSSPVLILPQTSSLLHLSGLETMQTRIECCGRETGRLPANVRRRRPFGWLHLKVAVVRSRQRRALDLRFKTPHPSTPHPHPALPAPNPDASGDLGTDAGLGSSQRLCDNLNCIGSERGSLIYSISLNYTSFTTKKNVVDWIEHNQYFCTP